MRPENLKMLQLLRASACRLQDWSPDREQKSWADEVSHPPMDRSGGNLGVSHLSYGDIIDVGSNSQMFPLHAYVFLVVWTYHVLSLLQSMRSIESTLLYDEFQRMSGYFRRFVVSLGRVDAKIEQDECRGPKWA